MTARVYRVELFIFEDDNLGAAGVKEVLENTRYPNHCMAPSVVQIETREIEWSDDHPLNRRDTFRAAYEKLFGPRQNP